MKLNRIIFIPIALVIAVAIGGNLALIYVQNQESEKLDIKIQITAEQVGIRLHEFINTRLTRLDFLRERMEHQPLLKESDFRTRALLIQHELPGFQAINWIDENGIIQWITPLSTNQPAMGVNLVEQAAKGAAQAFSRSHLYQIDTGTPLIELVQGGVGVAFYLPITIDDNIAGYINGVFRVEELILQCFGNSVRAFNYTVLLSGTQAYLRGESKNFENPVAIGRHNFTILGQSWELQIVPGSSQEITTDFTRLVSQLVIIAISILAGFFSYSRIKSNAQLAEAHKIVEDSEIKFRTIFDKSPACLLRYSSKGVITDWNLEAASLFSFEFPPQESRNIYDHDEMTPIIPSIEAALQGQDSEYSGFLDVQGKKVEVDAAFERLVSGTDHIHGGIILLKDVTQQNQTLRAKEVMYEIGELTNKIKELPELFEAIQHSLSAVLDTRNFYVALYNEERDEFTYPYYHDEFDSAPPDPVQGERGISAYVLKSAQPILVSKENFYAMNKEGKIDLLGTPSEQWLGSPLIVEGKPIGVMAVQSYSKDVVYSESDKSMLGFVSDQIAITIKINIEDAKLRDSEARHRQLASQLSDSNNIKALLLDILSHDLKNPAGVISSVAEILTMEDQVSEEVQLIKDSSDALLKVIANTTALARVTLGERIAMESLDLSELALELTEEFKPGFLSKQKPLKISIVTDLICTVNPIIAEIFRNYLSNALKYAPEGQEVKVTLEEFEHEIRFTVSDMGNTIHAEDQIAIFQRSVQLENGKMRGSGLGLAIVKRIAEAHGAEVGVEANDPKGNIFYMNLPKSRPSSDQINETGEV